MRGPVSSKRTSTPRLAARRSDRRGRKAMMALGLMGFITSFGLCGLALWLAVLVAVAALLGVSWGWLMSGGLLVVARGIGGAQ